jgi:hypothetical protein
MRRLAAGVVLGLILGTAGQAGATYLTDHRIWYRLDRQAQTAYVAGVADSMVSVAEFSRRAGGERAIDGVRQAARCADRVPLQDLARFGGEAVDYGRRVLPSTAIIERFVACGRSNYGSDTYPYSGNPDGRPYYWGPNGQPVYPEPNSRDGR